VVEKTDRKQLPQGEGGPVELVVSCADLGSGQGVEFTTQGGSTVGASTADWGHLPFDLSGKDEFHQPVRWGGWLDERAKLPFIPTTGRVNGRRSNNVSTLPLEIYAGLSEAAHILTWMTKEDVQAIAGQADGCGWDFSALGDFWAVKIQDDYATYLTGDDADVGIGAQLPPSDHFVFRGQPSLIGFPGALGTVGSGSDW
jgi:hypothetical protein